MAGNAITEVVFCSTTAAGDTLRSKYSALTKHVGLGLTLKQFDFINGAKSASKLAEPCGIVA